MGMLRSLLLTRDEGTVRLMTRIFKDLDIEAQHFTEQQFQILTVALGIALGAGIAHAEIEKAIRPKQDASAVVVLSHARDAQDFAGGFA